MIKLFYFERKRIWLSPPHMGGNELKYIHEAFDTNWISQFGKI
jgi:dTDP-4-amino-4,6-dideoxygalactose transaminase